MSVPKAASRLPKVGPDGPRDMLTYLTVLGRPDDRYRFPAPNLVSLRCDHGHSAGIAADQCYALLVSHRIAPRFVPHEHDLRPDGADRSPKNGGFAARTHHREDFALRFVLWHAESIRLPTAIRRSASQFPKPELNTQSSHATWFSLGFMSTPCHGRQPTERGCSDHPRGRQTPVLPGGGRRVKRSLLDGSAGVWQPSG